nr:hypothetical protein CFP56_39367 [Quercus suber]
MIWPLTVDGEYSVRSAYHLLIAAEDCLMPSSSSLAHDHVVWKKIWKMKVANKFGISSGVQQRTRLLQR